MLAKVRQKSMMVIHPNDVRAVDSGLDLHVAACTIAVTDASVAAVAIDAPLHYIVTRTGAIVPTRNPDTPILYNNGMRWERGRRS